jgi:hypothetical protein
MAAALEMQLLGIQSFISFSKCGLIGRIFFAYKDVGKEREQERKLCLLL